ncbi:hypothetical protein RvY_18433 [Ramazzottius varieornatus]|uniref:Apple domain-containing protein n=1 Tax=Ramazzottius varieornatus TaxID=947166 RepID=A0A1D1W5Q3_RAMVA|nr:hypothetical protein RvY_18433 [Ramazzottius varieornatus]
MKFCQQLNSNVPLLDKAFSTSSQSAVVIVQGWAANATSGFAVGDRATDVQACLEQCRNSWSPRCRLVSYNIETGARVRFTKQSVNVGYPDMYNQTDDSWPWPMLLQFRRDNDGIIAAYSQKKFELLENAQVDGHHILYFSDVRSAETCRDLCHVHPTCNVASSSMYGSVASGCQLQNIVYRNPFGPVRALPDSRSRRILLRLRIRPKHPHLCRLSQILSAFKPGFI